MKYILGYILIFLSLELTLSANSKETYGTIRIPSIEKCNSFQKGDTNWYYNNCDQLGSLKSGVKINKKEKVEFTDCSKKKGTVYKQVGMDELGASFFLRSSKINDLRGDGIVYYKFRNPWVDNSRYYLHKRFIWRKLVFCNFHKYCSSKFFINFLLFFMMTDASLMILFPKKNFL